MGPSLTDHNASPAAGGSSSHSPGDTPSVTPAAAPWWLPLALLVLLGALWGLTFSLSKLAISNGVHPLGYAVWQTGGPALLLLVLSLLREGRPRTTPLHLRYYLLAGLLGIAIPNTNFAFALRHIPAGLLAIVVTLVPLLTYVLAVAFGMERPRALRFAGLILGLGGALCLVLPQATLPGSGMSFWVLLSFVTPIFYSINTIYSSRARPADSGSIGLACGMLAAAALWQLPFALAAEALYWPALPFGVADWALAGQVVAASFAYVVFFELLRIAGPVTFSQVAYIVTLTGLAWGKIFFDEQHSGWVWIATGLIFSGVALVNWRGGRATSRAKATRAGADRADW